ncbi:unnamed protein product [Staurois parvus]|uniref:Uncharacterized protein n=1 Tax=Staurois parvus TaxID=386267 RepID=A0ABN9GLS1_9NEOB|nr:unnamed protein product [Staurois parvus]
MALSRKGLTSGVMKGLTVGCVCMLHCKHIALHGCALCCAQPCKAVCRS